MSVLEIATARAASYRAREIASTKLDESVETELLLTDLAQDAVHSVIFYFIIMSHVYSLFLCV